MASRITSLCVLAVLSAFSGPAHAADLIVHHGWEAPAELAALNVLKGELENRGHRWISLVVPHDEGTDADVLSLIADGMPPNIFLEPSPAVYRALSAKGHVLTLDEQFADLGLMEHLPEVVRQSITVDGQIVKVPVAIHADAMLYFNRRVAEAAGIAPEQWTSLEDMWADFGKVEAAGFQPLAMGAQTWQVGYLFHSLVAAVGGGPLYAGLYGETPDPAAFEDEDLLKAFDWLRRFQLLADAEAPWRRWNAATNMVITGTALMQLQGDWMKGEWRAAGKSETDYGCVAIPGALGLPVTVDAFGLLGGVSPEVEAAERDFAGVALDRGVQTIFARAKGATPIRLDARKAIDGCSHLVLDAIDQPGFGLPTPHLTAAPAWLDRIWSVTEAFWKSPDMAPADGVAALRAAYDETTAPSP